MSRKLSTTEKIGLWALIATVIGVVVVIFLPEIRRGLHLDKPAPATASVTTAQQTRSDDLPQPSSAAPEASARNPKPSGRPNASPAAPHATARGNNGAAVGSITQGPGSIAQIGGTGNQATIIGAMPPPPRILSADESISLANAVRPYPATILILYIGNDDEAYRFAKQIGDALTNAGWTLKQPVTGAMMMQEGGGPLYGMQLGWNGAKTAPGAPVDLDPATPWGSLGRQLNKFFREDFFVMPSPGADKDMLVLQVYRNPKAKPD